MQKPGRQRSKIRQAHKASGITIIRLRFPRRSLGEGGSFAAPEFDIRYSSFVIRSEGASYFLRSCGESGGNGSGQAVPPIGFLSQTLAPLGRQFIKLGAPIVV